MEILNKAMCLTFLKLNKYVELNNQYYSKYCLEIKTSKFLNSLLKIIHWFWGKTVATQT